MKRAENTKSMKCLPWTCSFLTLVLQDIRYTLLPYLWTHNDRRCLSSNLFVFHCPRCLYEKHCFRRPTRSDSRLHSRHVQLLNVYIARLPHGLSPKNVSELLTLQRPSRLLRSNYDDNMNLKVPNFSAKNYDQRAFVVCAPRLWNNLPKNLRISPSLDSFKLGLKTPLYYL